MGGYGTILRVEWSCCLGPITMDFKDLCMSFSKLGHKHTLQEITSISLEIVISHHYMENLLKKRHSGTIS